MALRLEVAALRWEIQASRIHEGVFHGLHLYLVGHGTSQVLVQSSGPMLLPINGGLKGTTLAIFNGNRKHTKQFTQEFTLYRMINQDSLIMCNTYT